MPELSSNFMPRLSALQERVDCKKNPKKQNEQTVVSASCEVEGKVIKERCESVFPVSRLWLHTYVQDVQRKPRRSDSAQVSLPQGDIKHGSKSL